MSDWHWVLQLPYEAPPLSMNDRGQTKGARQAKSAKAAMIRADVNTLAKAAGIPPQQAIHVRLHYRPKTAVRHDADNLVATLKPAIDGLRDAKVISDDDPKHLDWSAPRIHPPSLPDRTPALWLVITALTTNGTP